MKASKGHEGFLFPDTFELVKGAPASDLVRLQLEDFKRRVAAVDMRYARSKNLTTRDVITIASMIEDEVAAASQRKLVAAVIYNRLHEGMPLGIDATVRFATGNYDRPLTESQLAVDSPYNTRVNAGLPPGPIDSPGLASIEAAAHPAKVGYLYYVTKPGTCGKLAFSEDGGRIRSRRRPLQPCARRRRRRLARYLRRRMKRLAVIGHPVAHSRSPAMHNAALAELGLAGEWRYEAIDLAPDELEPRVRMMEGEGFAGANVTVPHKGAALSLADTLSETAREIGAANTLSFAGGEVRADNTDAQGLLDSLSGPPAGKRALVLGAGGAARAVVWALLRERAEVDVWNRTPRRAESLCAELGGAPVAGPVQADYGLIVNTSAAGLHGEDPFEELPLDPAGFGPGQVVVDLVYGERPSPLLAAAEGAGAATVDGIEVLVRQGALSLQIWTGLAPPLDTMRAAARA